MKTHELEPLLRRWMLGGKSVDEFVLPTGAHWSQVKTILERWDRHEWLEWNVSIYWSWLSDEGTRALTDVEVDAILAMSDEEILEDARREGIDIDQEVALLRAIAERAIQQSQKSSEIGGAVS